MMRRRSMRQSRDSFEACLNVLHLLRDERPKLPIIAEARADGRRSSGAQDYKRDGLVKRFQNLNFNRLNRFVRGADDECLQPLAASARFTRARATWGGARMRAGGCCRTSYPPESTN